MCEIRHAERVSIELVIEYRRLGDVVEDKRWLHPGGAELSASLCCENHLVLTHNSVSYDPRKTKAANKGGVITTTVQLNWGLAAVVHCAGFSLSPRACTYRTPLYTSDPPPFVIRPLSNVLVLFFIAHVALCTF